MGWSRYPVSPKRQRTTQGITFDSKLEMERYQTLCLLKHAGEILWIKRQPEFKVTICGKLLCTYTADFKYQTLRGDIIIEDCKSSGTAKDPAFRLRKKAAELFHNIKVTEVISK